MNRNTLSFWLPEGIDPSQFPGKRETPAKVAYIFSKLTVSPYDCDRDYININKQRLRSLVTIHTERIAFAYFRDKVECDRHYEVGVHSKGYRLGKLLRGKRAIRHECHCPQFASKLFKIRQEAKRQYSNLQSYIDESMKGMSLEIDISSTVANLPPKAGVKDQIHRLNVIQASAYAIQQGDMGMVKVDQRSGRVYTSVNRLSKHLRRDLTLFGEQVCEIDLASSQPYFLCVQFQSPAMREAVSCGEFYQRINDSLDEPFNMDCPDSYGTLKQTVLAHIYANPTRPNGKRYDYTESPTYKCRQVAGAMERSYPGINDFLRSYRAKHGDKALPVSMQKVESEIFIQQVLHELMLKDIPASPIHDSILCRISDAEKIEKLLEETLEEKTGIKPTLRREKREI